MKLRVMPVQRPRSYLQKYCVPQFLIHFHRKQNKVKCLLLNPEAGNDSRESKSTSSQNRRCPLSRKHRPSSTLQPLPSAKGNDRLLVYDFNNHQGSMSNFKARQYRKGFFRTPYNTEADIVTHLQGSHSDYAPQTHQ